MNRTEAESYRNLLEVKRAELKAALPLHRNEIAVNSIPDLHDQAQQINEQAVTIGHLTRDGATIKLIDQALDRIRNGDFGICMGCEQEIKPKRLDAVPWARFCASCQETADHIQPGEILSDVLAAVAATA